MVSGLQCPHVVPDLNDLSADLVPYYQRRVYRVSSLNSRKIATANAATMNFDENIGRILDLRNRNPLNSHSLCYAVKNGSHHISSHAPHRDNNTFITFHELAKTYYVDCSVTVEREWFA